MGKMIREKRWGMENREEREGGGAGEKLTL